MSAEKRSVSTDALATLGTIITDGGRDAIHLAVEPVIAGEELLPGAHIGLRDGVAYTGQIEHLGIVDPFLTKNIQEGEKFWLIVYPRQITSLRHVWSHPKFPEKDETKTLTDPIEISKKWIADFADRIRQHPESLMDAAEQWIDTDDGKYGGEHTYDNSESYKDHWHEFPEFWKHYEVVTGKKPNAPEVFFTCSC
jgi:hypothetical protein